MKLEGREIIDFDKVMLESITPFTKYKDFINDEKVVVNTFGPIITVWGYFGNREIITGRYIPLISTSYDVDDLELYSTVDIPLTPYRGRRIDSGLVFEHEIDSYLKKNDNEEFRKRLDDFITSSYMVSSKKATSYVKQLVKRHK